MADREVHHYNEVGGGSGAMGFIGVILGALLVVGGIFFVASNWEDMKGGGTSVTVNTPAAPSAPSTTGSGGASK